MKPVILYLDDDAGCLGVFQDTFGCEYDVKTATTASEARHLLRECPADIIISDQDMPEIQGREFLQEMARAHPASHRMLLTGMMHAGEAIAEIHRGLIQSFISKPWTEVNMRRALDRAILQGKSAFSQPM